MPLRGDICQHFNASMFRYYLRKKYKTHKAFANRIGVSRQAVTAWESGNSKPTWRHLIKMAEVFGIVPRLLIVPSKRFILDRWEDHLVDFLMAPPEKKHQTKEETKVGGREGSETHSETKTKRELKLSERGAIDLTEKLGIFDEVGGESEEYEQDEGYDPLADLVED